MPRVEISKFSGTTISVKELIMYKGQPLVTVSAKELQWEIDKHELAIRHIKRELADRDPSDEHVYGYPLGDGRYHVAATFAEAVDLSRQHDPHKEGYDVVQVYKRKSP
jgi:hypothetical protein